MAPRGNLRAVLVGLALATGCGSEPSAAPPPAAPAAPRRSEREELEAKIARARARSTGSTVSQSPLHGVDPCPTAPPLKVTTQNLTLAHGDLCGAYRRVVTGSLSPTMFAGITAQITLTDLVSRADTTCKLSLTLTAPGGVLAELRGAAKASTGGPLAARDCIEAVIGDLMFRQAPNALQARTATPAPAAPAPTP